MPLVLLTALAGAIACGQPPVYSRDLASERSQTGGTWAEADGGAEPSPDAGHGGTGGRGTPSGGALGTGGNVANATGGTPTGGGGRAGASTGGAPSGAGGTGGQATGGTSPPSTGGAATGGRATGGATGGVSTGGKATGGAATGGMATGGAATGGASPPTNRAPTVSAGVDQTGVAPGPLSLQGTASDDGLPKPPGALTSTWSVLSGPGTVTFGDVHALTSSATFSAAGVYVLRLSVSDGALTSTDDVQLTLSAASTQPCAGICANPTLIALGASYSSGGLGTAASCFEVDGPINGGNCGNFTSPRVLHVNGVAEPCDGGTWTLPPLRNGGTCLDVSAGGQSYAFFTLW